MLVGSLEAGLRVGRVAVRLEDIAATGRLAGIVPGRAVTVLAAQMHGASAVEVTYQDDNGALGQVVLFRDDETKIAPHLESGRPFDAHPRNFGSRAERRPSAGAGLDGVELVGDHQTRSGGSAGLVHRWQRGPRRLVAC